MGLFGEDVFRVVGQVFFCWFFLILICSNCGLVTTAPQQHQILMLTLSIFLSVTWLVLIHTLPGAQTLEPEDIEAPLASERQRKKTHTKKSLKTPTV